MPDHPLIDLSYLEQMAAGDEATLKMMLQMTIPQLQEDVQKMRQLFDQKKAQPLKDATHHLKNTLSFVGNAPMKNHAESLMTLLDQEQPDWTKIASTLHVIIQKTPGIVQALQTAFRERFV
jgi:HPt (histidine-containing phosphotransfer) domain-containing protein